MSLYERALKYGSVMLTVLLLGAAPLAMADDTVPDTDPAFDDPTIVNQYVEAMFPTLPAGVYRGNYVLTGATGTGLNSSITGGYNVFDPFASNWLGDLAKATGLSGNAAFEAAFGADPSSVKVLGVKAVSGATVKWDGKYVYVNYTDTSAAGQFDVITNFGTFRSQVWANQTNVIASDSTVDVSGYKSKNGNKYNIPFAEFLKSVTNPNAVDSKSLWFWSLDGSKVKVNYKKEFVRVWPAADTFQIGWIAGNNGTNTDYAVFTGYTQASPAGGTSSGFAF